MGKLNIFQITFHNMADVFYPGTFVDGYVTVELTEPMKMKAIKLKFKGKALASWSEEKSKNLEVGDQSMNVSYDKDFKAKEKYFREEIILVGKESSESSEPTQLDTGRHTFPFKFQLPEGLPSSFEGKHGYVRYYVSCKIVKPMKFNENIKRMFSVISTMNLNSDPAYSQRCSGNKQKHLCCLCCKSGPITAQFSVERKGWVPGEIIKFYADISNGTRKNINKSYVTLIMKTTFHAKGKTKTKDHAVARVARRFIPPFGEDSWASEELVVPPLPPSFLGGCDIIDIQYELELGVEPAGFALDLKVPLPVVIGTVPLLAVIQQSPPMPPPAEQYGMAKGDAPPVSTDQVVLTPAIPPIPGLPEIAPPGHLECITGPVNIWDQEADVINGKGDLKYVPVYIFYNFGQKPAALPDELIAQGKLE